MKVLGLALVCLLAAQPAGAVELRRLGEVEVEAGGSLNEWLDTRRYVHLVNEFERDGAGRLTAMSFVVADVIEQKVVRLPFRLDEFARAHPGVFPQSPVPTLVYFRGDVALLRFDRIDIRRLDGPRETPLFCFWNPKGPSDCALRELVPGVLEPEVLFYPLGPDPTEKHLYFAVVTRDTRPQVDQGPVSMRLFRISLADERMSSNWSMKLDFPKRDKQLTVNKVAFSFDGTKLAIAEYHDRAGARKHTPSPPPQVYVIDLATKRVATYPIGLSPYGLSFSRDGQALVVGSHETGELTRIDLAAGKVDRTVQGMDSVHAIFAPAEGDTLLVFSSHKNGPKPVEVRRWKDLKLVRKIPMRSLIPGLDGVHPSGMRMTADGRLLVTPMYGMSGFPEGAGLVVYEVKAP
jgi:hypothetical protein